jgi:hypothetical protein
MYIFLYHQLGYCYYCGALDCVMYLIQLREVAIGDSYLLSRTERRGESETERPEPPLR